MSMTTTTKKVVRRLTPLYIAAFFQNFVLWYTIEKLFMHTIGFDDAGIGIMIAVYSVVMLVVETPSGILADRWSRKGVLALASVVLIASSLVGGFSYNFHTYLITAILWGTFFALYSGTYSSIVYDTICEELDNSDLFEKLYGRVKIFDGAALVISSIIGAALASCISIRAPYFLSVLPAIAAIIALLKFKEPKLHKSEVHAPIKEHIKSTFTSILKNKNLFPIVAVLVMGSTISYVTFEFSQLWMIAIALPTIFFGIASGMLNTSYSL